MDIVSSPAVLVTTRLFDEPATALLQRHGCRVITSSLPAGDSDLGGDLLRTLLEPCSAWIVGTASVTREVIKAASRLKVIARRGVGYDRVDTAAAGELGRVVTIAARTNEASVADHTLALMLATAKRLGEAQVAMRGGNWRTFQTGDLFGKTVGLVGLGKIGRGVAQRLAGFETRILASDPRPEAEAAARWGVAYVDFDTVIEQSDFVSLHLPLTPATRRLVGPDALNRMKASAILVNTSRGGLVDEQALLDALRQGRLGGAGLDVFEAEDDERARGLAEALVALPNVIASPHAAGSSRDALARGNRIAAECVLAVLQGAPLDPACVVVDGRKGVVSPKVTGR
jgi:D-3-phosphoglycerate dehydrogenase